MVVEKQIQHRGFLITVRSYPSRYGIIYKATNDYGEPYLKITGKRDMEEAIEWDKKNLDALLDQ